jgi:hypothetical protein
MVLGSIAKRIQADVDEGVDITATLHAELPILMGDVRAVFHRMDSQAEKSGLLTCEHVADGLRAEGYSVAVEEVRQLMSRMDISTDGFLQV